MKAIKTKVAIATLGAIISINASAGEVNLWHSFTGNQQEILLDLIEDYNTSQQSISIKPEYIPFASMKTQLSVGVAGGNLPDLVVMDNVDHASFSQMGVLEDITDRVNAWGGKEDFYPGPLASAQYAGKYYGLPFTSNTLGLYYNKEMLAEAGYSNPPTTWDELRTYAKKLTTSEHSGFAMSAIKSEEGTFQFYPFLLSSGAEYYELDSPGAIKSLTFLKSLIDDGSMSSDVINATQDDLARQFAQERLAMMVNGPWNIDRLTSENPDLEFAITQVPKDKQYASVLGGGNFAVIKDSNVDDSWQFMSWFYEPSRYAEYTSTTGVFPARRDAMESSDFWKNDQYLSGFVPIMEMAKPRGPSPYWPRISQAMQTAMQQVLTGRQSPEKALKSAAKKVDKLKD